MQITYETMPDEPDSTARCPKCEELVRCFMLSYVRLGSRHDVTLFHEKCNTEWKQDLIN